MIRGPLIGQVMSCMAAPCSSMAYRGSALLARQGVARKAVEGERTNERMRFVLRHGVTHGIATDGSCLEPPRSPAGIQVKAAYRRQAHDGRKIRCHVGHARPLAIDLHIRPERPR